jgi:hypothetical protein
LFTSGCPALDLAPLGHERKHMNDTTQQLEINADKSFEAYHEYTKTLRTWLVTYGIGGPILFISQEKLAAVIAASPLKDKIVYLFLGGVAVQIAIALLNKWTNWAAYALALNPPAVLRCYHHMVIWFANQFWIDMLCDLASSAAFVIATLFVLGIVLT